MIKGIAIGAFIVLQAVSVVIQVSTHQSPLAVAWCAGCLGWTAGIGFSMVLKEIYS